jgi:pyruvate dehydrogenase E2 component (dihydrolipoamide acetyltransferase)
MSATDLVPVEVPDIGDFQDVPVIEILVSPGDQVALDDPLLTLESDKATMDVPAPFAGTVRDLHVSVGDRVSQGTQLLSMERLNGDDPTGTRAAAAASEGARTEAEAPESVGGAAQAEVGAGPDAEAGPDTEAGPDVEAGPDAEVGPDALSPRHAPAATTDGRGPIYASPSVRRLARELEVELEGVAGTGRKGRITREDVEAARSGARSTAPSPTLGLPGLAQWPSLDFSKQGPVERVPRSRIQRISGPNLARNWAMIPHVTQHDETDITELEAWRKELNAEYAASGTKVTVLSFLVVACVAALRGFPEFNSSLDGEELILKRYYNIGFAADTPGGLIVPVIKAADQKGLLDIAHELADLSSRARAGKLGPAEMSGSTFTISSLGGIGGTAFTPIINAPEVAILGVSRSVMRPVWNGQEFVPRLLLPLSLSYDHRVIDGAAAARFIVHLGRTLTDLRRVML